MVEGAAYVGGGAVRGPHLRGRAADADGAGARPRRHPGGVRLLVGREAVQQRAQARQ